eukprot:3607916-Prymnesium_polylepis.1
MCDEDSKPRDWEEAHPYLLWLNNECARAFALMFALITPSNQSMPTSYPTTSMSSPMTHTPAAQHHHGPCATSPPTPRTRSYIPARPNAP